MPSQAPISTDPAAPDPRDDRSSAATLEAQKHAFLRMVTHELRTPLNSILGFSELISQELYGPLGAPQYKEYADIIRGSGKRLLMLVNQVLEIGRLQGLSLEVRPEPLEPALEEAIAGLDDILSERSLRARIIPAEPRLAVLADPWGLKTVLGALLQHACACSPQRGEVRVRIASGHGFVDLFVEDDGPGVPPERLLKLAEPFEPPREGHAGGAEAAGLGLTICELTCRAMGARLSFRSPGGKGLSARVRLPAA
ncbi:MAG TPA: HAMP domain-containing sensor histidine kinase [Phenylobacterium sp.]